MQHRIVHHLHMFLSLFSNKSFILPMTTVWGIASTTWTTLASTSPISSATTRNSENGSRFVSRCGRYDSLDLFEHPSFSETHFLYSRGLCTGSATEWWCYLMVGVCWVSSFYCTVLFCRSVWCYLVWDYVVLVDFIVRCHLIWVCGVARLSMWCYLILILR